MFRTSLAVIALLVGCKREPSRLDPPSSWGSGSAAPSATMPPMPPGPPPPANELSGTVAETMNSGGYTYARIERDGKSTWIAGPETKLAVGAKLGKMDGMGMPGFHSDTLNRTFDQIYFVNSLPIEGGATAPPPSAPSAPPAPGDDLSGVVIETMDAGGYTYAQIDHGGTKLWVAGPVTKLAAGSQLGTMTGTLMTGFKSDTLKRTFDQIYFVNSYNITVGAIPNPHTKPTAPAEPIEKIPPAAGGTTVADVFAKKDALVGKPVVVRGKVVKVNNGIMGRNWLHLRDGTGGATTDDLLVTTDATAKVGDVVVARGTVATHQDFGAGYAYDVIVEKATLADK